LVLTKQVRKQRSVVHYGLAQFLGVDRALAVGFRQCARCAIMLHDSCMLDGEIRHALVEVLDRVAAVMHHALDQVVRSHDGTRWVIHELRLHALPGGRISQSVVRTEVPNVEPAHAPRAPSELSLCPILTAVAFQRPVVLWAETLVQIDVATMLGAEREEGDQHDRRRHQQDTDDDIGRERHGLGEVRCNRHAQSPVPPAGCRPPTTDSFRLPSSLRTGGEVVWPRRGVLPRASVPLEPLPGYAALLRVRGAAYQYPPSRASMRRDPRGDLPIGAGNQSSLVRWAVPAEPQRQLQA